MKKLLVLIVALGLALSFAACGGDEAPVGDNPGDSNPAASNDESTPDSNDFAEYTGNGLSFALPVALEYVDTDEFGSMRFSNEERTEVVTVGVKVEDPLTSTDLTDDDLLTVLEGAGSLSDVTLESSGTVEQDGGVSVVGFGKGTLENGTVMNSAIQFFFPADGGYYAISYLYAVDGETSLEMNDNITLAMSTVKTLK